MMAMLRDDNPEQILNANEGERGQNHGPARDESQFGAELRNLFGTAICIHDCQCL
jgi:hypothetical protein